MTVYKSPWCGCCEVWVDAMKAAGFAVEIRADMENLDPVKAHAGVPDDMVACTRPCWMWMAANMWSRGMCRWKPSTS
ncbi:MAG: hypothetical protein R3D65_16410 [Zhengella sp.]|uniref:hypothetical protein n=1 Tax=Zhengella sp. TaxID=2282762 RepID=UPI003528A603